MGADGRRALLRHLRRPPPAPPHAPPHPPHLRPLLDDRHLRRLRPRPPRRGAGEAPPALRRRPLRRQRALVEVDLAGRAQVPRRRPAAAALSPPSIHGDSDGHYFGPRAGVDARAGGGGAGTAARRLQATRRRSARVRVGGNEGQKQTGRADCYPPGRPWPGYQLPWSGVGVRGASADGPVAMTTACRRAPRQG